MEITFLPTEERRGVLGTDVVYRAEMPDGSSYSRIGEDPAAPIWFRPQKSQREFLLDGGRMKPVGSARTRVGPVFREPNRFSDGTWKWVVHGERDPRKRERDQPVIEDLACDEGLRYWPDYVILPDGRQGPRPFRNSEEMRSYMRMTGHGFR